ncbi:helix-turn-helix domain-containing protein [Mycobacterium sp. 21AC1]|uniref:GlxA family transcriptional regulator n=1 Tax=[Mycobacterium] appelbergii TaxID=2939269 RepID=UPI0029393ABC|nr:helix-turn-helix domain-containing protein [Mycobacterium sp. 21AC1]MDV3126438.1 helix-turn-helix domain-containing protein [Mycobacterium sp. 21AC1]
MMSRSRRPHRVVALVRAPQGLFELGCVMEVFGVRRESIPVRYEFAVCAEEPGGILTSGGFPLVVTEGPSALDTADTIVVPGWRPVDAPISDGLRQTLLSAHARGCRLITICSGAFALAQTGLLDGRRATTHWAAAAELQRQFPQVQVDPDVLYVDHGDLATSAGAGAGIDLCLHLVRSDQGAGYAAQVARHMVMPPHREGGQAQYATPPQAPPATPPSLAELLDWVRGRLGEPINLEDMAAHLHVSPRTLARRFDEQLGTSPGQWLLVQRINAARALLEETDLPVEAIASRVGLASATNLRRRFHAAVHTTPAAYRRAFRSRSAP